jgi:hypothetical protein
VSDLKVVANLTVKIRVDLAEANITIRVWLQQVFLIIFVGSFEIKRTC